MGEVLGELLGSAVGVAVSPLPLVAAIMLLMAPGGRAKGVAFVAGWLGGMTLVLVVFALLGPLVAGDDPRAVVSVLKIAVGVLLTVLAVRAWRSQPDGDPQPPAWMVRVQGASVGACLGLGAALAGANPKNLGLTASAGGTIGAADLSTVEAVVVGTVFVVLASAVMLLVLGATVLAPARSGPALERLRQWLEVHNSAVMVVVLVVLAAKLVGDGLRGLT